MDTMGMGLERGPRLAGLALGAALLALGGVGGFGVWAATAPLSAAAVAPGTLKADSLRKTVRHKEGGVVAALLVREGERVSAGQVLLRMDAAEAKAEVGALRAQRVDLRAQQARLLAERDGADTPAFPDASDDAARAAAEAQGRIFAAHRRAVLDQVGLLDKRIAQQRATLDALRLQEAATASQQALFAEEETTVHALADRGLERRPRLLDLQRQGAGLAGTRADMAGRSAGALDAIAGFELQQVQVRADSIKQAAEDLRGVQAGLAQVEERLGAAEARLGRVEVRAPQDGMVVGLQVLAADAVVQPGGALLDLVPADEPLLVDARVQPGDIESVREGLRAEVRLLAFKQRTTPLVRGRVVRVSADTMTDERTGAPYFLARIALLPDERTRPATAQLTPGMPAEAYIVVGERTALDYLLQPVQASFGRAFRER